MPASPELQLLDTASGAFSSWERGAPVDCRCCEYFMMGGETEAGCCGHSEWLWLLLLLLLLENLENGFRSWGRRRFVFVSFAGAHPPVLFMKLWVRCVASNQNLFEFHPCLAHEARSRVGVLAKVLLPGLFKGDEGRRRWKRGRNWKGERMKRAAEWER